MAKKNPVRRLRKAGKPALIVKVVGPSIRPGRIPVPELLTICQHAQAAVNRQAEALEGRQTLHPRPKIGKVQEQCTLELVSLGKGSAILSFDQAKEQRDLPSYGHVSNLGQEAIAVVGAALRAIASGQDKDVDPAVLQSLRGLGSLVSNGVRRIEWNVPRSHGHAGIRARIDKKVQARIEQRLQPAPTKPCVIDGVLEMVDFKPGDFRCRIHPPVGQPVPCTFTDLVEEQVYANLRKPVRLEGRATINRHTDRIESLEIRRVIPLDPLIVNAEDFFTGNSFEQLARDQAVDPVRDPRTLAGLWRADEDVDAFVADVYRHRS